MKFKTGVVVGFAVGYVLGAKSGRERYEQLVTLTRRDPTDRSQPAPTPTVKTEGNGRPKGRIVLSNGLRTVSDRLRTASSD